MPNLDEQDELIIARREARFNLDVEPRCGDYVIFADGVERRISHVYGRDWGDMAGVQTSDGGSWYLGDGYVEFSGSLYPAVKMDSLTLKYYESKPGRVWIFHHDYHTAGWGVNSNIQFRIYLCSENAPK